MRFEPKLMPNADEIDAFNAEVFENHGIYGGAEERHVCVTCGARTSIDDSMSERGRNLVCCACYLDESRFPDVSTAIRWVHGTGEYEEAE